MLHVPHVAGSLHSAGGMSQLWAAETLSHEGDAQDDDGESPDARWRLLHLLDNGIYDGGLAASPGQARIYAPLWLCFDTQEMPSLYQLLQLLPQWHLRWRHLLKKHTQKKGPGVPPVVMVSLF